MNDKIYTHAFSIHADGRGSGNLALGLHSIRKISRISWNIFAHMRYGLEARNIKLAWKPPSPSLPPTCMQNVYRLHYAYSLCSVRIDSALSIIHLCRDFIYYLDRWKWILYKIKFNSTSKSINSKINKIVFMTEYCEAERPLYARSWLERRCTIVVVVVVVVVVQWQWGMAVTASNVGRSIRSNNARLSTIYFSIIIIH